MVIQHSHLENRSTVGCEQEGDLGAGGSRTSTSNTLQRQSRQGPAGLCRTAAAHQSPLTHLISCLLVISFPREVGLPGEGRDLSCSSGKSTVYKRYPEQSWGTQSLEATALSPHWCWINLAVLHLGVPLVSFWCHWFYKNTTVSIRQRMAYFPMAFLYFKQSSETWLVCAFAFYLHFLFFLIDSCMAEGITIFSGRKSFSTTGTAAKVREKS